MIKLKKYTIREEIYAAGDYSVFRGECNRSGRKVIIKALKYDDTRKALVSRFMHEIEIAGRMDCGAVISPLEIDSEEGLNFLVAENIKGTVLSDYLDAEQPDIKTALVIGLNLTDILLNVHAQGVVVNNLSMERLLYDRENVALSLCDLTSAFTVTGGERRPAAPELRNYTIACVSPEQTGRMMRPVDYRSDLYSLGVILYRLFAGVYPFEYTDDLEAVHAHIAQKPRALTDVKNDIPPILSDIVIKLLSKEPEERYQSAYGVKADILECLNQLHYYGKISPFALATHDMQSGFHISGKIYGRDSELARINEAIVSVCNGPAKILCITGPEGIGKTALTNEISRITATKKGYFVSCTFDHEKQDVPYTTIIQALKSLIRQVLTESEERIGSWKKRLLAVLENSGQLLVNEIPDLVSVIGEQPKVPEMKTIESGNRFNLIIRKFISAFASEDRPLVMVFNDAQWIDLPTLKILGIFAPEYQTRNLLFVLNYRDDAIDESHILSRITGKMRESGFPFEMINLQPVDRNSIENLISDTLGKNSEQNSILAKLCHQKTKGNPYFIRKFLDEAFKKGYLTFDPGKGRWDASVEQIRLLEITDNVADLYANKLRGLHSDIQDIIAYAACIGQTFSESLLKKIVNRPPEETETVLWTAVQEGLLQVLDDTGQRLSGLKDFELHFRFMHEKLLSVAYERLDESSRKQIHLQIGRIMLQERSKDEIQEHIYSILGHFHKSFDLITDTDEKIQLANLFLSAGKKAKTSAAFGHAYFYMSTGLEMLGKNSWSNSYDLTIELYKETAHAAFLNGMYEKMNEYCSDALENVIDDLDKTNIYELIIQAYIHINELQEAINTGYRVLRSIGIKMPVRAGKFRTITGLLMTRLRLSGKPSEVLLALPEMQDPYKKAAVHILTIIGTTVYFSMPGVMPLIVFELIRLSVRYGNTPASPFAYAAYGLILCGVLGRVDEGYKYGQLALGLLDRPGNDEHRSKTLMVVNNFITHRRKNARETIEPLLEGYRCGIRTGDYEFASLNAVVFCMNSFCAGLPLEKLSEEIEELCTNIGRINIKNLSRLQIYRQLIANLTGECNNADDLNGKYYKEEELDNYIRVNNKTALAAAYALKTITGYFFSNYNAAVESANECRKYLDSAVGIMLVAEFHLFGALSCLAVYNDVNASGKRRIMYRVKKSLRVLKKWSEDAPTNYLAKYYIVEAEKARISGREGMMRSFLDKAINIAGQHGNLKESALAGELAGRFYHSSDNMKIAKTYLNEACDKYDAWGATALSGKLRRYYPGIIDSVTEADQDSVAVIADRLDTGTIIKASVALAETLQLPALLERLLNIAIENTGATKGILVLKNNGEYTIEASSIRERDGITVRQSVGFEKSDDLSHAIVQYVIHTKKHVLLRDASADTTFAHDRYVSGKKPKSVLCVPLIHNNDLAGLFYLENNLTTGAFTEERKEILTLLSSQIVISIENARFYEDLEQKVEQRTYEISEKNKEITDSIRYAKRIQDTILVTEKTIHEYLPYSFIFFQPRDIVSGDFYWFNQRYGQIHIAAVDCTGHGVPGAFLSMLAYNELGRIIDEHIQPSKILDQLNINIYKLLNRDNDFETANKEGMDIMLCHIDMKQRRLRFAGAHQQLYHIRVGELKEYKGNWRSIGEKTDRDFSYTNFEVNIEENDVIYLFTDGFPDQFGGDNRRKFKHKNFRELIFEIHRKPMIEQKNILAKRFNEWKGKNEQIDDVLVIGISFNT